MSFVNDVRLVDLDFRSLGGVDMGGDFRRCDLGGCIGDRRGDLVAQVGAEGH